MTYFENFGTAPCFQTAANYGLIFAIDRSFEPYFLQYKRASTANFSNAQTPKIIIIIIRDNKNWY